MNSNRYLIVSAFLFLTFAAKAQTVKEFAGSLPKAQPPANLEEPVHHKKIYSTKKLKPFIFKRAKVTHSAQYEFYKRVEQAAKERQRILKKLYKPQFSNFLYYGHKRRPKKHSPDKMRYCAECGIRH